MLAAGPIGARGWLARRCAVRYEEVRELLLHHRKYPGDPTRPRPPSSATTMRCWKSPRQGNASAARPIQGWRQHYHAHSTSSRGRSGEAGTSGSARAGCCTTAPTRSTSSRSLSSAATWCTRDNRHRRAILGTGLAQAVGRGGAAPHGGGDLPARIRGGNESAHPVQDLAASPSPRPAAWTALNHMWSAMTWSSRSAALGEWWAAPSAALARSLVCPGEWAEGRGLLNPLG